MGLSSERALIRGSSDLDVFLSSLGTACKHQSASHYVWISRRVSLRVEKTGPQGDPDHVVSDRHLWSELSDLHLYDGRECLPLRRTCFRPALLHQGRGLTLGSFVCCWPKETRLSVSVDGSRCLRAGLYSSRTRAGILVVCGSSRGQRRGCPDLDQRHEQHSLASAILWALTGKRIREQDGPIEELGARSPVTNSEGKKIGEWPSFAS